MSLKENDKSLLPGSFFEILFDQFTHAYSQNARSGLFRSSATNFAHESWRSLHVSASASSFMQA